MNEFERRQLLEWVPKTADFLKHDDELRTYDDVFGSYRSELDHYCTCVFPRTIFSHAYMADDLLLQLQDGMRLLDLGCGSGAAADYFASRHQVEIVCVTNSPVQGDICRRKFQKFGGRVRVIVMDFDELELGEESFDAIYAFESIGYSKDIDAWLERCWRMLKPGGRLLIRSPGSLDFCRREADYQSVTAFFENWRYNFLGANVLVFKLRRLGFCPIRYRHLPFWAWGLTWNFLQHLFCGSTGCGCARWWSLRRLSGGRPKLSYSATATTSCWPPSRPSHQPRCENRARIPLVFSSTPIQKRLSHFEGVAL